VIGNGAILESTATLGDPDSTMAMSLSPKTGERIATFASPDKSFEFHLKIDQVHSVTFTETQRTLEDGITNKTLRICRFMKRGESDTLSSAPLFPMCSLILTDSSSEAVTWFRDMVHKYN